MTPSRPYLVRAIYEWLNDNSLTAHVLVDASRAGVVVPQAHVKDGRIVLNIAPGAVRDLFMTNDVLSFSARFGGVPMQVSAPMQAVLAIYSRENGQGMFFEEDEDFSADATAGDDEPPTTEPPKPSGPPAGKRPALRVVK
jgi:stringent starvation protein B